MVGDYVFVRDCRGNGNPMQDILVMWVGNANLLPDAPSMHAELNAARDEILGPAEQRTTTDVAYERAPFVKEVTQDGRCYSIANTVERPRGTDAPAAALKIFNGQPSAMHHHQSRLLRAVATYTVAMHKQQAPQQDMEALKEWREMINLPSVGCDDNIRADAFQLNIAPAAHADAQITLADVMGKRFGGPHEDPADCEWLLSSMTGLSDVPETYDPGRFYLLALGVFVQLSSCINVHFCGRLRHGGTPPLALPGEQRSPSAYRMVVIAYSPRRIASGQTRHAIGAVQRTGDPLYISLEMTGVNENNLAENQRANHAPEGVLTMTPESHCRFQFRSMALLVAALLAQLPASYRVHFDREMFLRSITAHLPNGSFCADQYTLGPTGYLHEPDP